MAILLQSTGDPTALLLPLAYGLAVFALLLGIYLWLNRWRSLRRIAIPYTLGALALGAGVGLRVALDQMDLDAINPGIRSALLVVLALCWTFVAIGLVEELLINSLLGRHGVTVPRLARDIARALLVVLAVVLTVR